MAASRGGPIHSVLESASEENRNLHGNIRKLSTQYNQELADLWYERDSLQSRVASYDNGREASCKSFWVAHERKEMYRSASVSSLLGTELNLASQLGDVLWVDALFVNETGNTHRTCIVELVLSTLEALKRGYRAILRRSVPLSVVVLYLMPF